MLKRNQPHFPGTRYVFATSTCSTGGADGLTVRLVAGTCWASEDPVCQLHPELFSESPAELIRSTPDPT